MNRVFLNALNNFTKLYLSLLFSANFLINITQKFQKNQSMDWFQKVL